MAQFVKATSGGRIVSYPEPRYLGEGGEVSAVYRPADTKPDLSSPSGNTHYLATHVLTGGEFGLYKIDMAPRAPGPSTHFHRSISESFFVLAGEVQLFDGEQWITARRDDFLYVPVGGLHTFRNGSDAAASMLLLFSPGAPREEYFENVAEMARSRWTRVRRVSRPSRQLLRRRSQRTTNLTRRRPNDGTEQPPTTASRLARSACPRCVKARLSVTPSHEHGLVTLDDHASTQRQHRCQQSVAGVNARDLGEQSLRPASHAAGGDVVAGTVPRTHKAPPTINRSGRQVGAQVSTTAGHREQLAVGIPHRVPTGPKDHPRDQLGGGCNLNFAGGHSNPH